MTTNPFRSNLNTQSQDSQLVNILDAIADAIIILDAAQRILFFNRGAQVIFGYLSNEIVGQPHDRLLPDRFVETHRKAFNDFMKRPARTLKMDGFDEPVGRRKDGTEFPVEVSVTKLFQNGDLLFIVILRDISHRMQTESILRHQAQIIDQIHDSVVSTDLDGFVTSWNKGAERMFGYSSGEALGKHISFVYPEDQRDFLEHRVIRPLKERGDHQIEVVMRRRDGHVFNGHLSLSMLRDFSGNPIGMIGYTLDTTELKRTERELRIRAQMQAVEAELGHQALLGGDLNKFIDQIVFEVAQTLNVEYCKVLELLPSGEELLLKYGVGWKDGYVGEALVAAKTNSQAGYTLLVNEPVIVKDLVSETRFKGPSLLTDHDVVSGMSVIILGKDRPYGILGAHTIKPREFSKDDVNFFTSIANLLAVTIERKRAEEHLAYQSNLLANIHDAVLATDEAFALTSWNKAAEKMYGWTADEVLGKRVQDVIPSDLNAGQFDEALKVLEKDGSYRVEEIRSRKDGQPIYVEVTSMTLKDEEGHITGYVSVNRDITERKRTEKALRESEQRLRELSQRVVTTQEQERKRVSRELHDEASQMLMALKIRLDTVRQDLPEEFEPLHDNIIETLALTDQTMDRIRLLAHGLRPPELDAIGLEPVLENYCQEFAARTRLKMHYRSTPLPDLPDDISICFYRVLQEALTNILKHARAKNVQVALVFDGEGITLSVGDDGQGIPPPDSAASSDPQGIGITGMRERLELLGGKLVIKSRLGKGTHLNAYIPLGEISPQA
jgi:two-component system sensor kinase FixL